MYSPKFQKSETQKKTNEQTNETNNKHKKRDNLSAQAVFPKEFSEVVYLFLY